MSAPRKMKSRFDGSCAKCKLLIPKNSWIYYDSNSRTAEHDECHDAKEKTSETALGDELSTIRGSSSSYKNRADKKTWLAGSAGERRVRQELDSLRSVDFVVLHSRSIPDSQADLDHIVVTPSGVYYIDSKHYADKKISFSMEGSAVSNILKFVTKRGVGMKHLTIDGKNSDTVIEPFYWELEQIRKALPIETPLRASLCFINGLWESNSANKWINHGFFWLNTTPTVFVCSPDKLFQLFKDKNQAEKISVVEIVAILEKAFPPKSE